MSIVDAHVHVLPERVRADPASLRADRWFSECHASPRARLVGPEELIEAMDADAIDRAVCFTWPFAAPAMCAEANDWLAAVMRRYPERIIGFGIVNPRDPGAAREATRCARLGLRGIGELNADAQGWDLGDLGSLRGLVDACVAAGLTWNLHASEPVGHAYPGKGTAHPQRIEALAAEFGELRIVAAHLGGGLPFYAHMPEVRALFGNNLWVDTAALPWLYADGAVADVVRLIGAERVLLGSDFPLLRASRSVASLRQELSDADAATVLGGAAERLFG